MQPVSMQSDNDRRISRLARLGARVVGRDEREVRDSLFSRTVRIGIAQDLIGNADSRLTLLTLCNHVVRFCPNVVLDVKDETLVRECVRVAALVRGDEHYVRTAGDMEDIGAVDVTIVVGYINPGTDVIIVTSEGWLARLASGPEALRVLPIATGTPNPVGAIAAACLGSGEVFLRLIGSPTFTRDVELTMLTGRSGVIGTFEPGPDLPNGDLPFDGLLVGCGGVGNGWAYAIKHLPLSGDLKAVDRQRLGPENFGPYVVAMSSDVGAWKVDIIRTYLSPRLVVTSFPEEFDLFTPRIRTFSKFALPPIVICGLDKAVPRHSVQRLWPETLIDLAAGGTTAQVHLHCAGRGGQCLLNVHTAPPDEPSYAERVSVVTGLRPERILDDYNRPITDADVAVAPSRHKASLEAARRDGQLICGRIGQVNSDGAEDEDESFTPAAPFVAGLAGVMGASLTLQAVIGTELSSGWHWQYSFESARSLRLTMSCSSECECRGRDRLSR
jgi:molybdopterin/thiamine biosynthesis adenylyltransferase